MADTGPPPGSGGHKLSEHQMQKLESVRQGTKGGAGGGSGGTSPRISGRPLGHRVTPLSPLLLQAGTVECLGRRRLLLVGYGICGSACLTLTLALLFQV